MRRLRRLGSTLLALMMLCGSALAEADITAAQMQGDLTELCGSLERQHIDLFAHVTQAEWEAERQRISDEIPEMTPGRFYYELRHLVALVGDAHTNVSFTSNPYRYLTALPFAVAHFSDGWRLLMLEERNRAWLGYELIAIDGVPIEEVFERSKGIISHENDEWVQTQFSNTINFLEALQHLGVTGENADSVTLTVRADAGSPEEQLIIPAMDEQSIFAANIASFQPEAVSETAASGIYRSMALGDDCLFIQYNSCQESADMPMRAFADAVGGFLAEGAYARLIVDLRYNSGGDSSVLWPLTDVLADCQRYNGLEVYVLIGPNTFSSAIINAIELRGALGATLVGQPTGGSVNAYGEILSFPLPHMPLSVSYSTKYFEMAPGYPEGEPPYPDVTVEPAFGDYRAGRDAAVEAVLALD